METRRQLVLQELAIRKRNAEAVKLKTDALLGELFPQQVTFIQDPAKEKGALCTRRAGKTQMWSRYAPIEAMKTPRSIVRIWGPTRQRAKELMWDDLRYVLQRHKIDFEPNGSELTIRLYNGSEIRLVGADKDKEVQKKRGDKTTLEIVLEAQTFASYLKKLVEDVATPSLSDLAGTFCLEGTPGPVCAGYWWEVSGRENFQNRWMSVGGKDNIGAGWSMHRWSVLDNPHLPHMRHWISEYKARKRWADDNPTYMREWLGKWVNDFGALFYAYDPVRNSFEPDILQPWGPGWEHTLGWDLGFKDDMALVVWGWHPSRPELYEAFSWKKPGALAKEVIEQIDGLVGRGFNFVNFYADTGGGGRMYVEEVQSRYAYTFQAAKKTEKYEHVRLMNDEFRTGFLKLQQGSEYAQEIAQLPKDPDWDPENKPEEPQNQKPPTEDPHFPNHCCDAGLYAFRGAFHYLHKDVPLEPKFGSAGYYAKLEDKIVKQIVNRHNAKDSQHSWLDRYDRGNNDFD